MAHRHVSGRSRAVGFSECSDAGYVAEAVKVSLATEDETAQMAAAWSKWGESHSANSDFTWRRSVALRPGVPAS